MWSKQIIIFFVGFDLCLEEHTPTGDSASYRCVPATKPEYCSKKAWEELRVTETFGVVEGTCPGSYTDVPGVWQLLYFLRFLGF